jgi:hypothetical protein
MNANGKPVWCTSNKPMVEYWIYKYTDRTPSNYGGTQIVHVSDEGMLGMNLRSAEDTEPQILFIACEERIY